ncbi:MAG: SRPBCC family protein [Acidimicrobiales bacterium]
MEIFEVTARVEATPEQLWAVWSDVDRWAEWDPHEHDARLDDAFATGSRGWSKPVGAPAGAFELVEVEAPRRWTSRAALPGRNPTFEHQLTATPEGADVTIRATATEPLAAVVRLIWARRMRRDAPLTIAALGRRAAANRT